MKNTISRLCGLLLLVVFVVGCSTAGVPPAAAPAAEPTPTPTPHDPTCLGIIDFDGGNAYALYAGKPNKVVGWTFHLNFRDVPADAPTVDGCFRVYVRDDGNERFTPINNGSPVTCTVNGDVEFNPSGPITVTETSSGTQISPPLAVTVAKFNGGTITCDLNIQDLLEEAQITAIVDNSVKEAYKRPDGAPDDYFDQTINAYVMSDTHTYEDFAIIAAVSGLVPPENTLATYDTYTISATATVTGALTFSSQTCWESGESVSNQHAFATGSDLQYWWYDYGTVSDGRYTRLAFRTPTGTPAVSQCVVEPTTSSLMTLNVSETHTLTIGPLYGLVYEVMIDPIDAKPPADLKN